MTLRETITADATAVFLNTSEFAETVTYQPFQFYGESSRQNRSIAAVVEREDQQANDAGDVVPVFFVRVANSSTLGISSEEIDLGGDIITLPPRDGQTATARRIVRITEQDHGMLVLQCQ